MEIKIKKDESGEANPPTLQKLFTDSSVAKLLDFLTLYRDFDYPKTEISKNSGVSWKTLFRIWPVLEEYKIVVKTRQIGRATLYKLNPDSEIAKTLHTLALEVAAFDAEKIAEEEIEKEQIKKARDVSITA
ncbi:MAG: hypothetical protein NWF00_00355 [Candidatus Bathyarchaeota archaeon]|nr:hypothetical protein [Candidatus Bathyarchaeota archaeon]